MNILITSAGRRVSLIRFAKDTIKRSYPDGKVHAIDMVPSLSAACQMADNYAAAPRVSDPSYPSFLLNYCIQHAISIVIPTIDTELVILSELKLSFSLQNITIIVSDKPICDTFYLKSTTYDFFDRHGFLTPAMISDITSSDYPLFAKLDNSSCSIGAMKITSAHEALRLKESQSDYIFQEYIEGEEYTVDFYLSKNGQPLGIVPRKRIEVRAGEVSKSITCKDSQIIKEVKRLAQTLDGGWGPMTLQLFKTAQNHLFLIEINPRLGGGYPLSYHAGMNIFHWILLEISGESLDYDETWEDHLTMLRYDAEVLVHDHRI